MIEKQEAERLIDNHIKAFGRLSSAMSNGDDIEKAGNDLKDARDKLLTALTDSERPEVDLHKEIMNIQVDEDRMIEAIKGSFYRKAHTWEHLYNVAFRDARHAAAEIVAGRWRKVEP